MGKRIGSAVVLMGWSEWISPHQRRVRVAALCALCLTCCMASDALRCDVEASEVVDGIELRYVVRKGVCGIVGVEGRSAVNRDVAGTLVVPERLDGYEVKRVCKKAFSSCDGIESVRLPSCLEQIGAGAFASCRALRKVCIPRGLKVLSPFAFAGSGIESVQVPCGVSRVGCYAFEDCFRLKEVDICQGVEEIGEMAFLRCSALGGVTVPDTVTNIAAGAFAQCTSMTNSSVGRSVETIGEHAFRQCMALRSVCFPDSMRTLGNYAFESCSSLVGVDMGKGVVALGDAAFRDCKALNHVVFPESLKTIGCEAFCGCPLESVELPRGLMAIGGGAFKGCAGLRECRIPETVTNIGRRVFSGCLSLGRLVVDPGNRCYKALDGELLSADGRQLLCLFGKSGAYRIRDGVESIWCDFDSSPKLRTLVIPAAFTNLNPSVVGTALGVTNIVVEIGNAEFSSCGGLLMDASGRTLLASAGGVRNLVVSGGVEKVASHAMQWHPGLTTCRISGVVKIGEYAFSMCGELKEVYVDVGMVGQGAFANNRSLSKICVGMSVGNVGRWAFSDNPSLKQVAFMGDAPVCGAEIFDGTPDTLVVLVRKGSTGWGADENGKLPAKWQGKCIRYEESP